jgi:excisionase family DNA binding protein
MSKELQTAADDMLTIKGAAFYLGDSEHYIRRLLMTGEIQGTKSGRSIVIRRGDLDAWLDRFFRG